MALRALLLLALWASVAAGNEVFCGKPCKKDSECGHSCQWCGESEGYCRPICGKHCTKDSDCGHHSIDPHSPCNQCHGGRCKWNSSKNCSIITPPLPPGAKPPSRIHPAYAPVLASAWNATVDYLNYTDGSRSTGKTWYDYRFKAARFDFPAPCPLIQAAKWDANAGPCSAVFYEGETYYIYPEADVCCKYNFPVWSPDSFQKSNATYMGTIRLPLGETDIWDVTQVCQWDKGYAPKRISPAFPLDGMTLQRRVFVDRKTRAPFAMNETLSATMNYFTKVSVGDQNPEVFTEMFKHRSCVDASNKPESLSTCTWYGAMGRLDHWGYL